MPPHVYASTRDHIVAIWESVLILIWRVETTMAGVLAGEEAFNELARQFPGGVFVLIVVEEGAPIPPPEVRAEVAKFLASQSAKMLLSAVVHEGTGFRAAAVRSVVTGLAIISKLPHRHKIFSTVTEASAWFAANSPVARAWGRTGLISAVSEVRKSARVGAMQD